MEPHGHCESCFKVNCKYDLCKLMDCIQPGCGQRMHSCKQQDHLNICLKVRVPCLNSEFGCNLVLLRDHIRNHLQRCPASVVNCKSNTFLIRLLIRFLLKFIFISSGSFEYNRWPVHSREKRLSNFNEQFKNKLIDDSNLRSNLNIALAYRDQEMLNELYKYRSMRRLFKNNLTRLYPAVPISTYVCSTKVLNLNEDTPKDLVKSSSLTKCSSFVSTASYTASTITNSDDDSDSPWKLHRSPPGLTKSVVEKLTDNGQSNGHGNKDELTDESTSSASTNEDERPRCKVKRSKKKFKNQGKLDHLILDLNIEFIANHQIKPKQMYTFLCASDFRRDEYCSHYQNVHR